MNQMDPDDKHDVEQADQIITSDWVVEGGHKAMLECRKNSLPQVDALLLAGWMYELPEIVNRKAGDPPSSLSSEPWQWYWRSPPKRKSSKGRKYWSTTQAFNALKRSQSTNEH